MFFLRLEGKACKSALELDVKDTSTDAGVENIIACLDNIYLEDKIKTTYEIYKFFLRSIGDQMMCRYQILWVSATSEQNKALWI